MGSRIFTLRRAIVAVATAAALAAAPASAAAGPVATASLGKVGDRARDCTAETFVPRARPGAIAFTVWCGTQSGKVRFTLDRAEHAPIQGFSRRLAVNAAGAGAPFRCYRRQQTVKCVGRKQGPATIRGWISVAPAGRCAIGARLETAESIDGGAPLGCPGTHAPRPPRDIGYMRGFRRQFGLDLDLHGNRAAVDRRIRGLIRAWKRGDPVARYTAGNLGLPLRPRDQTELDFRDEYLVQIYTELDEWVPRHARGAYAGYDMDHEHGGTIYIGFVGDQDAQLMAFLRSFDPIAPGRIKPFPVAPRYTEGQLEVLGEQIWGQPESRLAELVTSIQVNTLANSVEVGTEHVTEVHRLIAERFGPEAPFLVVFERPGVLL